MDPYCVSVLYPSLSTEGRAASRFFSQHCVRAEAMHNLDVVDGSAYFRKRCALCGT